MNCLWSKSLIKLVNNNNKYIEFCLLVSLFVYSVAYSMFGAMQHGQLALFISVFGWFYLWCYLHFDLYWLVYYRKPSRFHNMNSFLSIWNWQNAFILSRIIHFNMFFKKQFNFNQNWNLLSTKLAIQNELDCCFS